MVSDQGGWGCVIHLLAHGKRSIGDPGKTIRAFHRGRVEVREPASGIIFLQTSGTVPTIPFVATVLF